MIVPSYASVCASASSDGQYPSPRIDSTTSAGTPGPVVMKYATASPRRPSETSVSRCVTKSAGAPGRLSSTTNGGS